MSNGKLSVCVKKHFEKCKLSEHVGCEGCIIWVVGRVVGEGDGVENGEEGDCRQGMRG